MPAGPEHWRRVETGILTIVFAFCGPSALCPQIEKGHCSVSVDRALVLGLLRDKIWHFSQRMD